MLSPTSTPRFISTHDSLETHDSLDMWSRRKFLTLGGLTASGWPGVRVQAAKAAHHSPGPAKRCLILFLFGGPPQHATWDPKPEAPEEIRGEFPTIATNVPGIALGGLFPQLARHADKLCILRAVSTGDNAHSSSGYYMLTGVPHQPMQVENAKPGPPNDWPNIGAVIRQVRGDGGGLPAAVRLPMHFFNTDQSVWPGQDAGFLGRAFDPWLFRCQPHAPELKNPELTLPSEVSRDRLADRRRLWQALEGWKPSRATRTTPAAFAPFQQQALDLLDSPASRAAFDLDREPVKTRDRYGRTPFGQSCLLARRFLEAGVSLVQVNWYRGPEEPSDAPVWDTHSKEHDRLRRVLAPTADQALSAVLEDLAERGLLAETLVVCLGEFGRTPRFNSRGGRDHWGAVFSVWLAGGGVTGGAVYGASDKQGAYPKDGRVLPQDIHATIYHCLGIPANAEIHDPLGRPIPVIRGEVIRSILA